MLGIRIFYTAVLSIAVTVCTPVQSANNQPARSQISFTYAKPTNPIHWTIHNRLKAHRVLEQIAEIFSPVKFPRPLHLGVAGCKGAVDAFYEEGKITVCYEYIQYVISQARFKLLPAGLRRRDAIIGPTLDVFFHEMGHAIIDLLDIPVFGREEDAADQISTYIMLQFPRDKAVGLISGTAFLMDRETRESLAKAPKLQDFADEHGLPGQRYFGILCLAYGFDPKNFAFAVDRGGLPAKRARDCKDEYAQVHKAFQRLVAPHVDREKLEKIKAKQWFESHGRSGRNRGRTAK